MYKLKTIVCIVLAALTLSLAACETPKWDDPAYVNKKLQDEDRNTRSLAMSNVSSLDDDKMVGIVPGLISVYKNDSVLKKDAMKYLLQIRSPEAVDIYFAELENNDTDNALGAAGVIGDLKDVSLADKLINVYKSTDKDDVKIAILQSLRNIPVASLVPELVETLKIDVDRRPIALAAYSCELLTQIAIKDPSAIDDAAVKQITLAMFYANRTNQTLDKDCGLTVQALGDRAIPELLSIYKGEREDIKALFLKYDTQDSPYPPNLAKIVAVQRLASLRAKELGPLAIEDLNGVKAAPKQYAGMSAVNWRVKEAQLTSEELFALGTIGAEEGLPLLESVVKGGKVKKEWDDITDRLIELQLRQDASFALVRLGNRAALPSLIDAARNGVIVDMERTAEILAKRGQPLKDVERYQMNWIIAQSFANLALGDQREEFEKLISERQTKAPGLAKKLTEMLVMFDVARECEAKGGDKEKAECYGQKLTSENELEREKAAWELGRLGEVATPVLNANLGTQYLGTREILEFYIYKIGNAETITTIDKVLADEANRGSKYLLDHYRLKLAKLYLESHKK